MPSPHRKWTPVRLVPFAANHRAVVTALAADPLVRRFSRIPDPPPPDLAAQWLERYKDGRRHGTRAAFAILAGGTVAGMAVAPRIDQEARTAELGYMILRKARGHGIATSALRLLSDWAFAERGLVRLELRINVENQLSKRVASTCGYRMEGVLRSIHQKQQVRIDCEIWSRLVTDPAPRDEGTGRQSGPGAECDVAFRRHRVSSA
jgi:RimJ/RimL family protein N-acetyltransferase